MALLALLVINLKKEKVRKSKISVINTQKNEPDCEGEGKTEKAGK